MTSGSARGATSPRRPPETGLSHAAMMTAYERDRLGFLLEAAREKGPVVRLGPQTYLVADPPAVMAAFQRTGQDVFVPMNLRREKISERRGDASYEAWMLTRRVLARQINDRQRLAEHREWLAGEADRMIDGWLRDGEVAEPVAALERLTTRAMCRFLVHDDSDDELAALTLDFVQALRQVTASPVAFSRRWRVLPRYRRFERALGSLDRAVAGKVRSPGSAGLLPDLLTTGLEVAQAERVMLSLLNAGAAFPSFALAWAVVELARHGQELASGPTKHLEESMRMWPPGWLMVRETRAEADLGGWLVPAGSALMLSAFVTHRTAPCFSDPDTFRPSRWPVADVPRGAYFPFGAGARFCVGAPLANVEMDVVLQRIASRTRIDVGPVRPDPTSVLAPSGPPWRVARGRAAGDR